MPTFILRKIRKAKWYKSETTPWLLEGDLQADALVDLATKGNKLSVYLIHDDYTNLDQVVAALASNCDYISDFDFALFDQEILWEINISIDNTEGDTPDPIVNAWHLDLVELSINKIMVLCNVILTRAQRKRFLRKQVFEMLTRAVVSDQIELARMKLNTESIQKISEAVKSIDPKN